VAKLLVSSYTAGPARVTAAAATMLPDYNVITLPSGYDKKCLIPKFAVRNDAASDLVPFFVQGWPFAPFITH
jgi:hypothetical protein